MSEITVVALIKAKSESVDVVREQLLGLIEPSLKDEGCLRYELSEGLEGEFVFTEKWTSKQALDDHLAQPHVQSTVASIEALVEGVEVKELKPLA